MTRGRDALVVAVWLGLTGWGLWRTAKALIAAVHGLPITSRKEHP